MIAVDPLCDAFRQAFRRHPAGVAVLTAAGAEGPVALTVSSLVSLGATPPLVGFSLSAVSGRGRALAGADSLVIHMLQHADRDLAQLCATPGADRFNGDCPWEFLPDGEPRFTAVETWFRAVIEARLPHAQGIFIVARLVGGAVAPAAAPPNPALVYLDRDWYRV